MPEAAQPGQRPDDVDAARPATPPAPRRRSVFQDPVVVRLTVAAIGLVILFLALVVGALITGVTSPTGPRTLSEQQVAVSGAAVRAGSKDPAVWGGYISGLVANGDYAEAEGAIADAKRTVVDSSTGDIALAEARLLSAQKKYSQALSVADKAMKTIKASYDAKVAAGGSTGSAAKVLGLPENYYVAALVKAYAYRDLKQWDKAVGQYDIYIAHAVGASDILVDRGHAKLEAGDKAGAEKDFRKALEFVPDDKEALDGLKKIGVSK